MKTILIMSQKGGSSKTTLTSHLAVEAERSGEVPVWIIDTDKQRTLTRWHERREADTPSRGDIHIDNETGYVELNQLTTGLARLAEQGAAYCLIDTPPTITHQTPALIQLADMVVIPVRPSAADLWAVGDTVELVNEASKPFLFVITQAKTQAKITAEAVASLSEHGRVAKSFIGDRVPYASALTSGNTAPEIKPRGPEAEEVAALWREVKTCFVEKLKTARKVVNG